MLFENSTTCILLEEEVFDYENTFKHCTNYLLLGWTYLCSLLLKGNPETKVLSDLYFQSLQMGMVLLQVEEGI